MQLESPFRRAYRDLTARVMATVEGAFQSGSAPDASSPIAVARRTWQPVPAQLKVIDDVLADYGQAIVTTSADKNLSDAGRAQALRAAGDTARSKIDATTGDILQRTDTILTSLRTAAYPARPAGDVAAQEATLAGIKGDVRMVLDPVAPGGNGLDLIDAMKRLLGRAIGDGDQLASWLLASTHWPTDYLDSRGLSTLTPAWDAAVAGVLDAATPPDLAETRSVYRKVSNAQNGLPVLPLLFTTTLPKIIEDSSAWGSRGPFG